MSETQTETDSPFFFPSFQASSYGAFISPLLDSQVTHVISDSRLKAMEVARKLGCSSWEEVEGKVDEKEEEEGKKKKSPFYVSSRWFEVSEKVG